MTIHDFCPVCHKCVDCSECACASASFTDASNPYRSLFDVTNDAAEEAMRKVSKYSGLKPAIYVIGSMRNPRIPVVAKALRDAGYDAFDDWYSPGPEADDKWQAYEKERGRTYREALAGHHAQHVFALDKLHLDRCAACVLVAPAGKSGHLELGYMIGRGKPGYILLDGEPERYDIMTLFATGILSTIDELLEALR